MSDKTRCEGGCRTLSGKEEKKVFYRLEKRTPREYEAPGEVCWDLVVENEEARCTLEDVARSVAHAERLKMLFETEGVLPEEAPYIMEDLLATADMLE